MLFKAYWNHGAYISENKLACITTDNSSNVTAAVEMLGWSGLSCFGHNLHLAITNAMKDNYRMISRTIGIAHKIVGAFAHRVQTEMNLPQQSLKAQ